MANVLQACCNLDCQSTQCCSSGSCCMYPAVGFGTLWFPDDAPSKITFRNIEGEGIWDGSKYVFAGAFSPTEDVWLTPNIYPEGFGEWNLTVEGEAIIGNYNADCLFDSYLDPSGEEYLIADARDFFKNQYTVTLADQTSQIVTRLRLCLWAGTGASLNAPNYYNLPNGPHKWSVNGQYKQGNQDSPIGTYDGGITVS